MISGGALGGIIGGAIGGFIIVSAVVAFVYRISSRRKRLITHTIPPIPFEPGPLKSYDKGLEISSPILGYPEDTSTWDPGPSTSTGRPPVIRYPADSSTWDLGPSTSTGRTRFDSHT